jgi:hypothetical protein
VNRIVVVCKAINQLGMQPVALNALYRLGLLSGHYRRMEKRKQLAVTGVFRHLFLLPTVEDLKSVLGSDGQAALLTEGEEILSGKVRLFGGVPVAIKLVIPAPLEHWTVYESGKASIPDELFNDLPAPDIKFIWEPARFGWAFTLGRSYHLTGSERYAEAFWHFFETFTDANPFGFGPNWMNGQEVALRLLAFIWTAQVFDSASASTEGRKNRLVASMAAHAARVQETLVYARSQQNNHLLTEAAALLTAGLALPDHPSASRWCRLGWHWLNKGLQSQIDGYGEYAQHSTNYHRLMLQIVLWVNALIGGESKYRWPHPTLEAIKRSIHWLLSIQDADSGKTPNLGANDGSYIFPLSILPFADYRPVLQAAARAFLEYDLPHGTWDEMSLWLGIHEGRTRRFAIQRYLGDQIYGRESWAYLRTAQFTSRPSHADQLHLDLWWRGLNVALDAGTYLYNAPAPWDNNLAITLVHNTVAINGHDQMTRAGRFLYLDWVNAYRRSLPTENMHELQRVRGRYRVGSCRHTRFVSVFQDEHWLVEDELLPLRMPWVKKPMNFRLHWLLPDWAWEVEISDSTYILRLASPQGQVLLHLSHVPASLPVGISLCRAGETLVGSVDLDSRRGWVSPTYGIKMPALSLAVVADSANEVKFTTEFIFPT